MIQNIYWFIAIVTMLVLLVNAIYTLVTNIKGNIEFKKFKKKQYEMLQKQVEIIERNKS